MFDVIHYETDTGDDVFASWILSLRDQQAAARIAARVERLGLGLFGDCKPLAEGVWELRVDWGPGYRVSWAGGAEGHSSVVWRRQTKTKCGYQAGHRVMAGLAREDEMSKPVGRPHKEWLLQRLQDPGFAAEYLTVAAEDPEPVVYLSALRHVAEARGMNEVAKAAGIPRESLYRALSPKGNPRWSTLAAILHATGMKLTVTRAG